MYLRDFLESGVAGKTGIQRQNGKDWWKKKQSRFDAKPIQDGIYSIERPMEAKIYWRSWDIAIISNVCQESMCGNRDLKVKRKNG